MGDVEIGKVEVGSYFMKESLKFKKVAMMAQGGGDRKIWGILASQSSQSLTSRSPRDSILRKQDEKKKRERKWVVTSLL